MNQNEGSRREARSLSKASSSTPHSCPTIGTVMVGYQKLGRRVKMTPPAMSRRAGSSKPSVRFYFRRNLGAAQPTARVYRTRKNKAISSQVFLGGGRADTIDLEKQSQGLKGRVSPSPHSVHRFSSHSQQCGTEDARSRGDTAFRAGAQVPAVRRRPAQFSDCRST